MYKLINWELDWADEFTTAGFDIIPSALYYELMEAVSKLSTHPKYKKVWENEEWYFGTNEFHLLSRDEVVETLECAEDVSEDQLKILRNLGLIDIFVEEFEVTSYGISFLSHAWNSLYNYGLLERKL